MIDWFDVTLWPQNTEIRCGNFQLTENEIGYV